MYLRLAFAVAIHVEADIILIDEILAVGDEKFQKKCLSKLDELKSLGKSIIYVSHNIHSVLDFCDRATYLQHGRVVIDGPVEKTVQKYSLIWKNSCDNRYRCFYARLSGEWGSQLYL
jgi:ABC-type polysaccharide/polyol phosphate transport system ATPase subunit